MKKKLIALMMGMALAFSLAACGGSDTSSDDQGSAAQDQAEVQEDQAEPEEPQTQAEAEAESEGFTLLDVDASMITAGLYAVDASGEELVISLFNAPSGEAMISMFCLVQDEEGNVSGDVFCGPVTADNSATSTDDNGITWSLVDTTDVYTGNNITIGFAEADGAAYVLDLNDNAYEATYLSAEDTVTYMAVAAVLTGE